MSGGDLRIRNDQVASIGQDHQLEVIDAHSQQSGDFTEARAVDGKTVYLTREGAAALDGLKGDGFAFTVQDDPKGLTGWLLGDRTGPKGEQHQGKVGR